MKISKTTHPIIYRLLAFSFMITLLASLQISPMWTSAAQAAEQIDCAGQGLCIGIAQSIVQGGSSSGNLGGPTGPGGSSAPAPIPQICKPDGSECSPSYFLTSVFIPLSGAIQAGSFGCGTKVVNGITVKPEGVVQVTKHGYYYQLMQDGSYQRRPLVPVGAGDTCVYPSTVTNQGVWNCVLDYRTQIDRLSQSWAGAASGLHRGNGTISTIASLERDGRNSCKASADVSLLYSVPQGQSGWGQYQVTSNFNIARCTFGSTTFDGVTKNFGECAPAGSQGGGPFYLTVWCGGNARGLQMHDWTGTDCQGGSLTCTIPDAATYNGYATNPQALRDGKNGLVKWGTPNVAGGWGMTNWRSSTVINSGSSPRNTSGDNNESQQLFKSSVPFGSSLIAGQQLDQQLAFYTAGDSGSPFSMTRNYKYDTWFTAQHTMINNVNLVSGQIGTATYAEAVFVKNNKCGPQTSPSIEVIRAIGDSVK